MPTLFKDWPQDEVPERSPQEIIQMYEQGYMGALPPTPEEVQALKETILASPGGVLTASEATSYWAENFAGKLVTPFAYVQQTYPGCWPGPAQERGDCVSHSGKNARLMSLICEIISRKPDELSGKLEMAPPVSADGIKNGVLSTESAYWFRAHGGDGWSCGSDASVAMKHAGCVVRKNYDSIGIDLTSYSGSLAGKWGRSAPPSEIADALNDNLIRTVTEPDSLEEVREMLGSGYGISTCGGEGWSNKRDENGFSKRQGGWSHALAFIGFDDRDVIKEKYGESLVCILNSWGRWNSGGRRILGTNIDIPEGSFWAKWSDAKNRSMFAFSAVTGWPQRSLPPFYVPGVF